MLILYVDVLTTTKARQ